MPEYKLTITDIIKGLIYTVLSVVVFFFLYWVFMGGFFYLFGEKIRNASPIVNILIVVFFLVAMAVFTGFGKTFEAGFSPYKLFESFKKKKVTKSKNQAIQ